MATGVDEIEALCCPDANEACCAADDYEGEETPLTAVFPSSPTVEEMKAKLQLLQDAGVNVIVAATYPAEAYVLLEALEQMDYSPLTTSVTITVQLDEYREKIEQGWWQGEYVIGGVTWHPTLNTYGDFSQVSSATWGERYTERWDTVPDHNAAATYCGACVLGAAIEDADSLDTDLVAGAIRRMDMQEFFGHVKFNDDGQMNRNCSAVQYGPHDRTSAVVYPTALAAREIQFPTPTWARRRCQIIGPGKPAGADVPDADIVAWQQGTTVECSDHGLCNDDGECECEPGYTGERCQSDQKAVPQEMTARGLRLREQLRCRTVDASLLNTCASTTYVCGATCSDSQPIAPATQLTFAGEQAEMDHIRITGSANAGEAAAVSCAAGSSVRLSFAQLHNNSQSGMGGAAVSVNASTVRVEFSRIQDNFNTGEGAAGIYATQSEVLLAHTDFLRNDMLNIDSLEGHSAASLSCDASSATVTASRFAFNHGAAIALSSGSSLRLNSSAVHDNFACIATAAARSGVACAASAGILLHGGSSAILRNAIFFENHGSSPDGRWHPPTSSAGAILVSASPELTLIGCTFLSNRGLSETHASGAILATGQTAVTITSCLFDNNLATAPTAGGAVMAFDSALNLSKSTIDQNKVQDYPYAVAGSAGVYSERCDVNVSDCQLVENSAVDEVNGHASTSSFGAHFLAMSPGIAYVADTVFDPYDVSLEHPSTLIVPGVAGDTMRGSCEEYPCRAGERCEYRNASLTCKPCPDATFSADGKFCSMCESGSGPTDDRRGCTPCVGNNVSSYGVCTPCSGQASDNHATCEQCPLGQIPKPDRTGCQCELGTYDSSRGLITCVDQDFAQGIWWNREAYAVARDQLINMGLQCISCPPCVDCFSSPIRVRAGYGIVEDEEPSPGANQSRTLLRCRPETSHDDAFGAGELAKDYDGGTEQCLGGDLDSMQLSCAKGHEGTLCGACAPGFGSKNENECHPCEDAVDPMGVLKLVGIVAALSVGSALIFISLSFYIGDVYEDADATDSHANPLSTADEGQEGEPEPELAGRLQRAVSSAKLLRSMKKILNNVVSMSVQPLRIFLGYFQIAAHMGDVLHTEFPPLIAALFHRFQFLSVNIHGIVALECAGLKNFHQTWFFEVIVVPSVLCLAVLLFWLWRRSSQGPGPSVANTKAMEEGFFVLFLTYPFITNKLFAVLNCRVLSDSLSVLAADYSIDCSTSEHRLFAAVSVCLIVAFSITVPVLLFVLLVKNRRAQLERFDTPQLDYIARRVMTELGHDSLSDVQTCIVDLKLGSRFGSLINAYRPGLFVFECFDMLRKLMMVGFLTVLELGTTSQVVVGVFLSFSFFALHIKLMPFRHIEDNILRATTELHLFIVMMMVLTLKGDLTGERWGVGAYDALATILFIVFVPVALLTCVAFKWRRVVQDDLSDKDSQYVDRVSSAFGRHVLGRDKDEDRQLLTEYITTIEAELDSDYHVFISYRARTEKALALQLYRALSTMTLQKTSQKLRVYLDQVCLEDGQRWDSGFMSGLAASWVVCPIVTNGALEMMQETETRDTPDNVLLEWMGALELCSRGQVKAILPVIAAGVDGQSFSWALVEQLSSDAHEPTVSTAIGHLQKHITSEGLDDDQMLSGVEQTVADVASDQVSQGLGVRGVVAAIMRYQGIQLKERNDSDTLRKALEGLKLNEILAKAADDHGMDKAKLQAIALDSEDPVSTAIERVVSEAPPIETGPMSACAQRVLDTVSGILGGTDEAMRRTLSADSGGGASPSSQHEQRVAEPRAITARQSSADGSILSPARHLTSRQSTYSPTQSSR